MDMKKKAATATRKKAAKRTAKKAAKKVAAPTPVVPLADPGDGVTIRMYRQGMGDAFLLGFRGKTANSRHYLLIDCGVHKAQTGGTEKMTRIVADIAAVTGGNLDVVVATHEHTDHLSGFFQEARKFLGHIKIENLWLAWTESRSDKAANQMRQRKGHLQKAIEKALEKIEQMPDKAARFLGSDVIEPFFGFSEFAAAATEGKPTSNEVALQVLRERTGEENTECLEPGTVVPFPGVPHVRAYVLGPPRDEKLLKKSDPSGRGKSEVYLTRESDRLGLAVALLGADKEDSWLAEAQEFAYPFDQSKRVAAKALKTSIDDSSPDDTVNQKEAEDPLLALIRRHYGTDGATPKANGADNEVPDGAAWRRIDTDWMTGVGQLALNLDSDTNNTSLAFALEFGPPGEGKVILFPGDAQVGSWLSWQDVTFKVKGKTITCDDLFARTVVYKVSHHCSHNGTLKALGLEKLGDDLIAMIPVDRACAAKLRGWNMPYPPLYQALLRKTRGRVLRSDRSPQTKTVPDGLSKAAWKRFQATKETDLYFEFTVD
jgi:hypothetical protein